MKTFADYNLKQVNPSTIIKPFDCGDPDLNDFLLCKAKDFYKESLSVSYLLENDERTIAFFSIFNDSIQVSEKQFPSKAAYKKFLKRIVPHSKRYLESFPAIKIGRLAVCNQIHKSGLGKQLIDFIIATAIRLNKACACKMVTVDAYAASVQFYEKMGFDYISDQDKHCRTRQMYLDLSTYDIMNPGKRCNLNT